MACDPSHEFECWIKLQKPGSFLVRDCTTLALYPPPKCQNLHFTIFSFVSWVATIYRIRCIWWDFIYMYHFFFPLWIRKKSIYAVPKNSWWRFLFGLHLGCLHQKLRACAGSCVSLSHHSNANILSRTRSLLSTNVKKWNHSRKMNTQFYIVTCILGYAL